MKKFTEKYVNYHFGTIIVGIFVIISIVLKMYGNYYLFEKFLIISDIVFLLAILIGIFSQLILLKYINNNDKEKE